MSKQKGPPSGCPKWMMTMGDIMSLLLTFFVLLLTFSTVNEDQLMDVLGVMDGAMSLAESTVQQDIYTVSTKWSAEVETDPGKYYPGKAESFDDASVIQLTQEIRSRFDDMVNLKGVGFSNWVTLLDLEEGVVMRLDNRTFFSEGGTEISTEGQKFLEEVANLMGNIGNEIRLINYFASTAAETAVDQGNWVLAGERVRVVRDAFTERLRLNTSRFSIGVHPAGGDNDFTEVFLAQKIGTREISVNNLISMLDATGPGTSATLH